MPRERREILKNLLAKGFQERRGSKPVCLIYHTLEGFSSAIITVLSRGTRHKSIGDPLLNRMARQCELPTRKFLELVDCDMDQTEYEQHLKARGVIR